MWGRAHRPHIPLTTLSIRAMTVRRPAPVWAGVPAPDGFRIAPAQPPSAFALIESNSAWEFGFPCHSLNRRVSNVVVVGDGGQRPGSRVRRPSQERRQLHGVRHVMQLGSTDDESWLSYSLLRDGHVELPPRGDIRPSDIARWLHLARHAGGSMPQSTARIEDPRHFLDLAFGYYMTGRA
jgi:hypothetical protein